ncbi:N-acetylmuramoyl-L-alanine amidase [Enterococcus faecalis]|uniref:SH3 domain-containing protein n=1 Tax=Enterococcus faecalis TaxID=1351 RepID=UPI0019DF489B|nr:N-acetylmuramoyl-L-alanine amidase [Enterococcus faecalis]EGO5803312.1 N-acetylmuramoyl-L-alanine amidase [Enterococcus faecalis]EGO5824755.1 N-acetylmuramoyl-L-alanine amidase [Enterococcus faecalis]EGO6055766.1 N-acetylmuramoyl-L-alanine amidase [Enterococcus faecalis]EGO6511025.1 N-acetylmuramoyl-L-alanine amidase [Enterococcus faecalis]
MKKKILVGALVALFFMPAINVDAYQVETRGNINAGWPSTVNRYIIAHDTANMDAGVENEANNMLNNWQRQEAFTQYVVGGGGRVLQVAENGRIAWGAGDANPYAYAQVELANTSNKAMFKKDYAAYVNLLRDLARQINVTFDLDDPTGYGIKTHLWVTNNLGGNHTDPYGYLASWGISKAQFAQDLQTGLPEDGSEVIVNPGKPNKPKYKVGQHVRFTTIYKNPDAPISQHINAYTLWTQVGTITQKLDGRKNLYRIENSGKLLGYANDGDIAELWENSKPTPAKTFTIGVNEGIVLRNGTPSLSAPVYGIWPKGSQFKYDSVRVADGYVFLGGSDVNGTRIYIPVGPNDGNPSNTWGTGY